MIVAVTEFARIQISADNLNSGEFSYCLLPNAEKKQAAGLTRTSGLEATSAAITNRPTGH